MKSGAHVVKQGDKYIWQGDVFLSEAQLKQLDETGDIISEEHKEPDFSSGNVILSSPQTGYAYVNAVSTKSTAMNPTSYNLWAMVRFTYAKSGTNTTLNSYTKILIQQALEYWEEYSNIRFYYLKHSG